MHYDAYGNREILRIPGAGPHMDLTLWTPPRRYLVWITNDWTGNGHTGQRKTYRTEAAAIRRAKCLAKCGLGVFVTDRLIRPGDSGFLADRSGSYLMEENGTLHTGTFDEIEALRRDLGWYITRANLADKEPA